jgi:hypothetical protein
MDGSLKYEHTLKKITDNLYIARTIYYSKNEVPYLDTLFSHVNEQGLYVYLSETFIDRVGNPVNEIYRESSSPPIVFWTLTVDKWLFGIKVLESPELYDLCTLNKVN